MAQRPSEGVLPVYPLRLDQTKRGFWNESREARFQCDDRDRTRLSMAPDQAGECSSRSEEHTSELQSLMRISYAVFCLKKKKKHQISTHENQHTEHTHTKHTSNTNRFNSTT